MSRARSSGIPEEKYAFARVASFLYQGDTAGAAAVLPRWDGPAGDRRLVPARGGSDARARRRRARPRPLRHGGQARSRPRHRPVAQARATASTGTRRRRCASRRRCAQVDARPRRARWRSSRSAWGRRSQPRELPAPPEVDEVGKRATSCPRGSSSCPTRSPRCGHSTSTTPTTPGPETRRASPSPSRPAPRCGSGPSRCQLGDEALARKGALAARCSCRRCTSRRARWRRASRSSAGGSTRPSRPPRTLGRDLARRRRGARRGGVRAGRRGRRRARARRPCPPRRASSRSSRRSTGAAMRSRGKLQLDAVEARGDGERDDAPWSDLVAMDAALDEGDLALGRQDRGRLGQGRGVERAARPAPRPPRALRGQARRGRHAVA